MFWPFVVIDILGIVTKVASSFEVNMALKGADLGPRQPYKINALSEVLQHAVRVQVSLPTTRWWPNPEEFSPSNRLQIARAKQLLDDE